MAAATGVRRDRIEVIWNPAVDAGFAARAAAPADHPWFGEPVPVFVTAGRLTEQKDHATLLRALRVRLAHGPARLLILGEGPARAGLEALAAELGVAPHVAFLGFVANPLPYMRQAAAFVLSSRYEGFGLVLAEAMGCGAPVVSTDCPHGPSEILAGGAFGVLTPVADAEALGLAMAGDLRARFPAAALRARAAEFSSARGADAYAALIERVIARGAR
jgi:glycosyltransferase involved in cell wall biosynthesis